jgi:spore coat polysaccharide biosynthesis protein SpsF
MVKKAILTGANGQLDSIFLQALSQKENWSKYRIAVDYPEDFEVVDYIFNELKSKNIFGSLHEVIQILDDNLEIKEKNSQYYFGQDWEQ